MTLEASVSDELAAWDHDCLLHPTTHVANHARGDVLGHIMTRGRAFPR